MCISSIWFESYNNLKGDLCVKQGPLPVEHWKRSNRMVRNSTIQRAYKLQTKRSTTICPVPFWREIVFHIKASVRLEKTCLNDNNGIGIIKADLNKCRSDISEL